jgi:thermitase
MRRRNLLIMLFLAVSIWASSAPGTEGVLAKDTDNALCSTPPAPASPAIDDKAYVQTEPVEISSPPEGSITPASDANQAEPLIVNDLYIKQPTLSEIEVSRLRQLTTVSRETTVAVLDTGIDQNHEELDGQVIAETNFSTSFTPGDIHGHGTHVAGIIAAKDNGLGITGVAPGCLLLNVKVADDTGRCPALALAKGITWAVDNGAKVINISIEIGEPSPELEKAVNYAWSQGSLIIAAAGNHGSESPVYPAYYENCLAVAAAGPDNNLVPLSNFGDWVDVIAPGLDIYSTLPDNDYGYKSGTSFACAYVSGIGALLFDIVTDANSNGRLNDEVRAIIESGCQEIDLAGVGSMP